MLSITVFLLILILMYNNYCIYGAIVSLTPSTALFCLNLIQQSQHTWDQSICGFPLVSETQSVTFVTLEASFPFNAPSSIVKAAGPQFRQGSAVHGGIGLIISTSTISALYGQSSSSIEVMKVSVEFAADSYTSGLFPNTTNDTVTWNNSGSIYVSNPLNTTLWLNSRIIAETTGFVYLRYISDIFKNITMGAYEIFQPVNILTPNIANLQSIAPINQLEIGTTLVSPYSSYAFVKDATGFLLNQNCVIGTFLELTATSFFYFHCCVGSSSCPANCNLTSVNLNNPVDEKKVSIWYQEVQICFSSISNSGSTNLWLDIQDCYSSHPYAYVYKNSSAVYNVSLLDTTTYQGVYNPMIYRYVLQEQTISGSAIPSIATIDIVLMVFFYLSVVSMFLFLVLKVYRNKESKTSRNRTTYLDRITDKAQGEMAASVVEIMPLHNSKVRISDMSSRIVEDYE